MNKGAVFFVVLLLSTSALSADVGFLYVTSVPEGAAVSIDGVSRGKTPLNARLEAGQYKVSVTLDAITRIRVAVAKEGGTYYDQVQCKGPLVGTTDIYFSDPQKEAE